MILVKEEVSSLLSWRWRFSLAGNIVKNLFGGDAIAARKDVFGRYVVCAEAACIKIWIVKERGTGALAES
jgi:hypothetical protein